jgi:hypothetical protein
MNWSSAATLTLRLIFSRNSWVSCSFSGVIWPVHDADHSHPSSAKVKNEWRYNSSPPISICSVDREKNYLLLMGWKSVWGEDMGFSPWGNLADLARKLISTVTTVLQGIKHRVLSFLFISVYESSITHWTLSNAEPFAGDFAYSRKRLLDLSCLSVRLYSFIGAAQTGRIFVKFDTEDFQENMSDKSRFA